MPGFDRTGPLGSGPRTGWGRGRCGSYAAEASRPSQGDLLGIGRGAVPWGGGRGRCFGGRAMRWHRMPFARETSLSPLEEAETLKDQLATAEDEVAAMKARLEELEKKK